VGTGLPKAILHIRHQGKVTAPHLLKADTIKVRRRATHLNSINILLKASSTRAHHHLVHTARAHHHLVHTAKSLHRANSTKVLRINKDTDSSHHSLHKVNMVLQANSVADLPLNRLQAMSPARWLQVMQVRMRMLFEEP
jgi:hypothetical protein